MVEFVQKIEMLLRIGKAFDPEIGQCEDGHILGTQAAQEHHGMINHRVCQFQPVIMPHPNFRAKLRIGFCRFINDIAEPFT